MQQQKNVYEKKLIFARFYGTASIWSRSLDQPLVPGVHFFVTTPYLKSKSLNNLVGPHPGQTTGTICLSSKQTPVGRSNKHGSQLA